jgi:hypothetical protein
MSCELAKKAWLVMVANGRVLYAVDGDVVGRVLDSARDYAREVQQAPAAISAALLANSIPVDFSFSQQAIRAGETIEMDMSNVPSEDVGEDFRAAQGAIYANRMMLTPLVGDRRS